MSQKAAGIGLEIPEGLLEAPAKDIAIPLTDL
jgi:hypothetical protein